MEILGSVSLTRIIFMILPLGLLLVGAGGVPAQALLGQPHPHHEAQWLGRRRLQVPCKIMFFSLS